MTCQVGVDHGACRPCIQQEIEGATPSILVRTRIRYPSRSRKLIMLFDCGTCAANVAGRASGSMRRRRRPSPLHRSRQQHRASKRRAVSMVHFPSAIRSNLLSAHCRRNLRCVVGHCLWKKTNSSLVRFLYLKSLRSVIRFSTLASSDRVCLGRPRRDWLRVCQ